MKHLKKIIVVGLVLIVGFSFLQGAKKKKKNINKYIFAGGNWLIVFDGASKTVQRREFKNGRIDSIVYFSSLKKIALSAATGMELYSINVNNLKDTYQVNLSQFNRYGKKYNLLTAGLGGKCNKKTIYFYYAEWDKGWNNGLYDSGMIPDKYRRQIKWNVANNSFKIGDCGKVIDDPYEASESFRMYPLTQKEINEFKESYELRKSATSKREKKLGKMNKRVWKYGKKFLKLLKKGKIDVGNYNSPSDLYFKPTGGRYMVVRNDKLYLVHMKTKKVYTLLNNPFMELRYFIIEKNEDDVDLDKE